MRIAREEIFGPVACLGREKSREGLESYYELKSIWLPAGYGPAG
jgi:hypothetical protein